MKKTESAFENYLSGIPIEDIDKIRRLLNDVKDRCLLKRQNTEMILRDYENALMYYASAGVATETAIERLDSAKLGGFYSRPATMWYTLDDAAKVYPLSMKRSQMTVFRLAVNLKAPVIPEMLQMALNFTIKRFPGFATTVKKGFFWHYLDTTKRRYNIQHETDLPCQPINIAYSGSQTFRVIWFNNRISVEFFHILTDGTGGMAFLKALLAEYMGLLGVESDEEGILSRDELPDEEETANEFIRAAKTVKSGGFLDKPATQMSGPLSKAKPCRVLHFRINTEQLIKIAKARSTTITAYMLSRMFLAGKYATDDKNGMFNIQVPVNMRKFYPSKTLRNFSLYCGIKIPIEKIKDDESLIEEITKQLNEKGSKAAMDEMMNSTQNMIKALRLVPLSVMAPITSIVYGMLGDKVFSNTLSNLGVIKLPDEYGNYVDSFDFLLSTPINNRASCTMVSYGNVTTLSISKLTIDPTFEETMYRLLTEDGVVPTVEGSALYEN